MGSHSIELDDIESFESIELDEVYDITVDQEHCYFLDCGKLILVHNSSKSFSIIQLLIYLATTEKVSISVTSCAFPHLRRGVLRDFMVIMEDWNLYDPERHTITEQLYKFPNGSYIEFFSADNALKVRGPGRDILFINEANLIDFDTFTQLSLRTKKTVFIDFNPAEEFNYIYDKLIPRDDSVLIKSTYKDNPFLPIEQVKEIERLKDLDPNFWQVYGMGERGSAQSTIYGKFDLYEYEPPYDYCFGLDFGFNHPNALVKCHYNDGELWFQQMLYQSHLTTPELVDLIKPMVGNKYVYCDTARPEIIEELKRAGINALLANKNVKEGINWIRANKINIHKNSVDLQKEWRQYKWKTNASGDVIDEPVKVFDDLCDSARYSAMSFKNVYNQPVIFGFR